MTKRYINILFTDDDIVKLRETAESHYTTISGLIRGVVLSYVKQCSTTSNPRPPITYAAAANPNADPEEPAPRARPMREMTPEEKAEMLRKFGVE